MSQTESKLRIIGQAENKAFRVEVLEYTQLDGSRDVITAEALFFAGQAGLRPKLVRITLDKGEAILESGALYFMKGNFDVSSTAGGSGGLGGLAKGIATRMLTDETVFRPRFKGSGQIYLEPSFGHFIIHKLADKQALIVDKGMFYCCEGSVSVSVAVQKSLSASALGGEGLFQTKVVGPGICVFASPVPANEVMAFDLQNDKLQVDGNFALMRTDGVKFSVKRSTKNLLGSATSGEGLLQTFEGTGRVWIAPTQGIYDRLKNPFEMARMVRSEGRSHTQTE
jgi:uncharacterized protein (AIM24 family)